MTEGLADSVNPIAIAQGIAANAEIVAEGIKFFQTQLSRRISYEFLKSTDPELAQKLLNAYNNDNERVQANLSRQYKHLQI